MPIPPSPIVSRMTFVSELSRGDGFIDLSHLSDDLSALVTRAGLTERLTKTAGEDGLISGREFVRLFSDIDALDKNGSANSFSAVSGDGGKSLAALLYEGLRAEATANRALNPIGPKAFVANLSKAGGTIDINAMSAKLETALVDAGIDLAEIKQIAGPNGLISSPAEFRALYRAIVGKEAALYPNERTEEGIRPTARGKLWEALGAEATANRGRLLYQPTGLSLAAGQPRPDIERYARKVPAQAELDALPDDLARAQRKAKAQRPRALNVTGICQFSLYPGDRDKGSVACFQAAVKQVTQFNAAKFGAAQPHLAKPSEAIKIGLREDARGRIEAHGSRAAQALAYIDRCLDLGYPVLVGVSYSHSGYNNGDHLTDHFVTIDGRGYDNKNRLYYTFKDPGAGGREFCLYVDELTGNLFKPGTRPGNPRYVEHADYYLTQVRTYDEVI